jgi:hypothetical protein
MQHLLEHAAAADAFGVTDQVHRDVRLDRLVGANADEVDMHDRALHRVALDLAREGELVFAVEHQRDDRVHASRPGEDVCQLP